MNKTQFSTLNQSKSTGVFLKIIVWISKSKRHGRVQILNLLKGQGKKLNIIDKVHKICEVSQGKIRSQYYVENTSTAIYISIKLGKETNFQMQWTWSLSKHFYWLCQPMKLYILSVQVIINTHNVTYATTQEYNYLTLIISII